MMSWYAISCINSSARVERFADVFLFTGSGDPFELAL